MKTTDFGRGKINVADHMKGYDKPIILIVTGERSVGKTTLINLILQSLPVEQYISFDDQDYTTSLSQLPVIEEAWKNRQLQGLRYIVIVKQGGRIPLEEIPSTDFEVSIFNIQR